MAKFHLTPKGQARACSAKTPEACKYSQEAGTVVEHYNTKEEAQAAYEKQTTEKLGSTNTLTKKKATNHNTADEALASEYFDKNLAKFSQGFPEAVIAEQKKRYIKDATENKTALEQLKEWDENRQAAADYFENNQKKFLKGFPDEVIEQQKQRYIDDVLDNEIAIAQLKDIQQDKDAKKDEEPQFKDNGDTTYKGVDVVEDEVIYDGIKFTRLDDKNVISEPYAIRVQLGKELSEEDAQKVAQLFGYAYAKTGGERGNHFEQDSPNSIVVYADTTKAGSYESVDRFIEELPEFLEEGTPVRKTDKAGPGTKGTRLVNGFDDLGYVELYADNTYKMNG